ncbi:MAG: ATP-binding protein [Candidatus Calescibacterium sp.]|nr:ATP-binding protein [Candidatus Calescibacterium sp.]MDW8087512.1 ATP-binding protein [Candidatus Calescibacterium sp.]
MVATEDLLRIYFNEAEELLDTLLDDLDRLKEVLPDYDPDLINDIIRKFHTLKGNSYSVGYTKIGDIFHKLEDAFVGIRDGKFSISEKLVFDTSSILTKVKESIEILSATRESRDDIVDIDSSVLDISEDEKSSRKTLDAFQKDKIQKAENEKMNIKPQISKFREEIILKNPDNNLRKIIESFDDHEMMQIKKLADEGKTVLLSFVKFSMDEDFDLGAKQTMENIKKQGFEIVSIFSNVEGEHIVFNFIIVPTRENFDINLLQNIAKTYEIWREKKTAVASKVQAQKLSLRVGIEDVERIMNIIGDMVTAKNALQSSLTRVIETSKIVESDQRIRDSLDEITRRMKELQDIILEVRMVPISEILKGIVRDIETAATQTGKLVEIEQKWGNIEIDAEIARKIRNSLLHIARNAVAHGIENPEERIRVGKSPKGKIKLIAEKKGGYTIIQIVDDGKGIDPEKIIRKYLDWVKNFPEIGKRFGNTEDEFKKPDGSWIKEKIYEILFLPGFSTKDAADKSAGRGAGLDEVKKEIESLKGKVEISSEMGEGTSFTVKIPTAKIIVEVVIFLWKGKKYAIPLSSVIRSDVFYTENPVELTKRIQGRKVISVGGKEIPIVSIDEIVGGEKTEIKDNRFLVLILEGEGKNTEVGLIVEEILDIKDSVMKNFDEEMIKIRGISAIIEEIGSDGRKEIVPVIDVLKIPYLIS